MEQVKHFGIQHFPFTSTELPKRLKYKLSLQELEVGTKIFRLIAIENTRIGINDKLFRSVSCEPFSCPIFFMGKLYDLRFKT